MRLTISSCLVVLFCLVSGCTPVPREAARPRGVPLSSPVPVLCLYSSDLKSQGLDSIDPKAIEFYRAHGFELHVGCYQTTDAKTLACYPVVIGMMPMLHAGTRAIGGQFGTELETYIRSGGSFALLPAPSYYGGEDFVRQLNPWLHQFGAELLNEQPRDPPNQRLLTRVIGYRYLATTNFTPHPITTGLTHLVLPLDYTDAYVATHTMTVSPDWQVLIRGNPTCATYPLNDLREGRKTPGKYPSAPPFLAVRPWGTGRLALFTTSSQYYIFDAYHGAFGNGYVMKEGGGRLMVNLLSWLAGAAGSRSMARPPIVQQSRPVQGNVMFCSDKAGWFEVVRNQFAPPRARPVAYVDCGATSDLPYSPGRGHGWMGAASWPVRWSWSEIFHPTAANARAFRTGSVTYRFDGLDPSRAYQVGLLCWAYERHSARPFEVKSGSLVLADSIAIPRFADQQGPGFSLLSVPATALTRQGTLELTFRMVAGDPDDFSSVGEIWLFESGGGQSSSGYASLLAAEEASLSDLDEPPPRLRPFRGLIGAQSSFSGGPSTVAELGSAARKAGYDYLVFSEDAQRLDAGTLAAFRKACVDASDSTFRCLPGIGFTAMRPSDKPAHGETIRGSILHDISVLPQPKDYQDPYNLFWSFLGGQRSGGRSATPTLRTPASNSISPFFQRFWRGFDVFSLSDLGRVSGDARDLYEDLLAAGYGPYPRVSGLFRTAASIGAAASNDWAVTIFADKLSQVESHHYTSCIGNGPRFKDYHFSSDHAVCGNSGEGLLFREHAWVILHADIEAPSTIECVTLFSGRTPLRRWYPRQSNVQIQEPIRVARNHELWMRVTCADGTEALTGRYLVEDRLFMMAMCGDNQNTICSLAQSPRTFAWEERDLFLSHSYWHTGEAAGQVGAMRRMSDIVPRVIETGIVQPIKRFNPCPVLYLSDGSMEDHNRSELRIVGASSDFNQVEYRFDTPASRARSRVLITSFRPSPSGDTVMLVETELEAKTNLVFKSGRPGLRHLNIAPLRDLAPAWNYTYRAASGKLVSEAFDYADPDWELTDRLAQNGGVMLWPSDVGSLLVLPLDDVSYHLDLRILPSGTGREQVQLLSQPAMLAPGQRVTGRLLVVLHQCPVTSGKALDGLRTATADPSGCVRSLPRGRLVDSAYALTLDAVTNGMRARLDTSMRTEPLPVALRGVNPGWPCGLVDGRDMRLLEAIDRTLRFVVPQARPATDYFAGNLVLSDQPELHIEWVGVEEGRVLLHLHNPTARAMQARIWTNPMLDMVPRLDAAYHIPPGSSAWVCGSGKTLVPNEKKPHP